ncbi:MAG: hypothetical protein BAJATHORv1_20035 [Candidatus Thorarchaeota archaeon]|nr:MAG: hypothetical protein BAJATHORv1_20035 [Candidatus Thorarchaeota archaeon]
MIFLSAPTAKAILDALEKNAQQIEISLDLGISVSNLSISDYKWDISKLHKIAQDPDTVYFINEEGVFKAAIIGKRFYKLMPSGEGNAPALLIDGVLMHRVKDIDPMEDARMKAHLCARRGSNMLEICTGLGYSTIACLEQGIAHIVTIEKESDVLDLAKINPWSQRVFDDEKVEIIVADASEAIQKIPTKRFHGILHDPPRFTHGSELYTEEFYSELYRVLRPKGVLYHYVGSPGGKHKKKDLPKGVMERLRRVGFVRVKRNSETLGVVAYRP